MSISTTLSIAAVERETRLSKDVLRVWERRYGFPQPVRDANGERCYPADQVERLRLMKRLMDQGHRPGGLAALSAAELHALALPAPRGKADGAADDAREAGAIGQLLETIRARDPGAFHHALGQALARQGLERFVAHTIAPLTAAVGTRWEEGGFDVFDEHFYTESAQRLLRQAIGALPPGREGPRILLTTVPGEAHGLGLLMVEALFTLDGAACVSLGTETPLLEIGRAGEAYGADIVALSFAASSGRRHASQALVQLRGLLPARVGLWAGGAGVARLDPIEGVRLLAGLDGGREALAAWRQRAA